MVSPICLAKYFCVNIDLAKKKFIMKSKFGNATARCSYMCLFMPLNVAHMFVVESVFIACLVFCNVCNIRMGSPLKYLLVSLNIPRHLQVYHFDACYLVSWCVLCGLMKEKIQIQKLQK